MPAPHKPVSNPLTIIAIFAGIIEASSLAALPFLEGHSQDIYTWFLVGFPPFLTLLFFMTLNFNHKTLYSPSDFNDPQDFLNAAQPAATASPPAARPTSPVASHDPLKAPWAMTHLRLFERDVHLVELLPGLGDYPVQGVLQQLGEALRDIDLTGSWVVLAYAEALPLKVIEELRRKLQSRLQARGAQVLLLDIDALRPTPVAG